MKTKSIFLSTIMITAFLITACGGGATPTAAMMPHEATATEAMMAHDTPTPDAMMAHDTLTPDAMMAHDTPTPDSMMAHDTPTPDAMMAHDTLTPDAMMPKSSMTSPAWYSASFADVRTGQSYAIQDFKGKVVLVETMAIWCPTCLKQQGEVKALRGSLGQRDDFVSIDLDIDPNENSTSLKAYAENNGFDWLYAVSTADASRELASLYGAQFLNPPSTPIVIIDRHGSAHPTPFGVKSADDLKKFIQPFLDEGM